MLTFLDWVGGPVVGSYTNDAILQSAGVKSKYGAVEGHASDVSSKADCNFLGAKCGKKYNNSKDKVKSNKKFQ
jgi:hypothetical protein